MIKEMNIWPTFKGKTAVYTTLIVGDSSSATINFNPGTNNYRFKVENVRSYLTGDVSIAHYFKILKNQMITEYEDNLKDIIVAYFGHVLANIDELTVTIEETDVIKKLKGIK
jgi:hypothetical protein